MLGVSTNFRLEFTDRTWTYLKHGKPSRGGGEIVAQHGTGRREACRTNYHQRTNQAPRGCCYNLLIQHPAQDAMRKTSSYFF